MKKNRTTVETKSGRELVITRTFDAPARIVYQAWTTPALLKKWWVPRSFGASLLSCELDARVGGAYRFVIGVSGREPMTFFGTYLEVTPGSRLVWTNEEGGEQGAVSTVTFEEKDGQTTVTVREMYPTVEALEAAAEGMENGMRETHLQLDELLPTLI